MKSKNQPKLESMPKATKKLFNKAESLSRLEAEVAELKSREDRGERDASAREAREEMHLIKKGWKPVTPLATVLAPVLESLNKKAEEAKAFADSIREEIASFTPDKCIDHPDTDLWIDMDSTFSASWRDRKLVVVFGDCPKCKEEKYAFLVNDRWRKRGIPEKIRHATFSNFQIDTPEKRRAWMKADIVIDKRKKGFLILRGKVGTGKSHLAAAGLKAVGDGLFVTMADLVGELRQTYSLNSDKEEMISKYREAKCLVIDELSKEIKGTDIPDLLYRILGLRYDKDMITIITSNESLSDIIDILGDKLTDRIKANYQVANFDWESYRTKT